MLALGPFPERVKDRKKNGGEEGGQGQLVVQEGNLSLLGYRVKRNKRGCNNGKL